MKTNVFKSLIILALVILTQGCISSESEHDQLKRELANIKKTPKGQIEPPPKFETYESFIYSTTLP